MSLLSTQLQAFISIVRQGTVHGAASELGLTQTAVTQRVRVLERELRTTLFLRSRKGMKLTQEGEALLRYCRGAEDLEGEALSQLRGAASERATFVTIAGPTSVMTSRIVDQCADLYGRWPSLYLNFEINDSADRVAMVRSGLADLAVVSPSQVPNEMDSKLLKPDRYLLVGAPSWRGRRLHEIIENERVIDFDEQDQTTLNYLKKYNLLSLLKKPRLFVNSNEVIRRYFSRGIGYGTLTQEIAKPSLEEGEMIVLNGGAAMEDPLALVWYPRPEMPAYFRSILSTIK